MGDDEWGVNPRSGTEKDKQHNQPLDPSVNEKSEGVTSKLMESERLIYRPSKLPNVLWELSLNRIQVELQNVRQK